MTAFFIVGVQRSGTTMLSVMLNNHKDIYMEDSVKAFRFIACLENMNTLQAFNLELDDAEFQEWILENDSSERLSSIIQAESIRKSTDFRNAIANSIETLLARKGKKAWGDKAPNLQHYISEIHYLLPSAKFIHILRDGRAVAASMNKRGYKNLKLSAQTWVDGNVCGLVNQQILGQKVYKILKYEDVLSDPEGQMQEICSFLNLPFDPAMIDLSKQNKDSKGDGHNYVKQDFDSSKINKWQEELSSKQIRDIEEIQIKALKRFGYEVSDRVFKPISLGKKLRLKQIDNWRSLFRREKKGMKSKQVVTYSDSFFSRLKRFLVLYVGFFLSKEINKSLFRRYNYKQKFKHKTGDKHE